MKFESMSDAELISRLKNHRGVEKEVIAEILEFMLEADKRELPLARGHESMYEFCLEELGYNKDEAWLRIRAMDLLKAVPETRQMFVDGNLTLSSAASVQVALRQEEFKRKSQNGGVMSADEKRAIVERVESVSVRNSRRMLATIFPDRRVNIERTKPLDETRTLIQFAATAEQMQIFEELKATLSHSNFENRWDVFFEQIARLASEKLLQKSRRPLPHVSESKSESDPTSSKTGHSSEPEEQLELVSVPDSEASAPRRRRYISVHTRRAVIKAAGGCCEFVDNQTGRRCGSLHALQVDHIVPVARGGTDERSNLRALCSRHNQFVARRMGLPRRAARSPAPNNPEYRYVPSVTAARGDEQLELSSLRLHEPRVSRPNAACSARLRFRQSRYA